MTGPTDRRNLTYIRDSIALIERYAAGGLEAFLADPMVRDAVLHRLETLSEATHRLSDDLKARHPAIPWRAVYGLRNVVAHAYLDLQLPDIWDTVTDDLPTLRDAVEAELADSASETPSD